MGLHGLAVHVLLLHSSCQEKWAGSESAQELKVANVQTDRPCLYFAAA